MRRGTLTTRGQEAHPAQEEAGVHVVQGRLCVLQAAGAGRENKGDNRTSPQGQEKPLLPNPRGGGEKRVPETPLREHCPLVKKQTPKLLSIAKRLMLVT